MKLYIFFYISDFVQTDEQDDEYKSKFGRFDCMYAKCKENSGIYLLKLYYK
jgi:hypothetical protein